MSGEFKGLRIMEVPDPQFLEVGEDELQRTEQWFKDRQGRFTGSEMSKLMTCGRASAKMEWGRAEKLVDFGETAKKYIYAKCKERQRNKVIRKLETLKMTFGKKQEDHVFELLEAKYQEYQFEKVGFIEFIPNVAGASPDGKATDMFTGEVIGLEIKCSTDWDTLYSRHEEDFEQSHQDFWQIQSEMMALKVNKVMYVVAEPPENILNPVIEDLSIKIVEKSEIHQLAIFQRCMIGEQVIKHFLNGMSFRESFYKALTEYQIKND